MSRTFYVGLSLMLLLAVTATASWAHDGLHPPVLGTGSGGDPISEPGGDPVLPLLVAFAAASALEASRRRRLALSVVVLLLVLEFETGLHAVHHLGEPARATECTTTVATAHLTGGLVAGVTAEPVDIQALHPVSLDFPTPVAQRPPAPYVGRSPPTSIA